MNDFYKIYISPLVTMADIQRDYFHEQAEKHYPGISEKYKKRFKSYYRCRSPHGRKLWEVFAETCEKEGIIYDMKAANQLIRSGYKTLLPFQLKPDDEGANGIT